MNPHAPDLIALSESDRVVAERVEDIRGRTVVDTRGDEVGIVDELLIDSDNPRVRYIVVASGGFLGFGKQELYIPVSAIKHVDETVEVDFSQKLSSEPPGYDPTIVTDGGRLRSLTGTSAGCRERRGSCTRCCTRTIRMAAAHLSRPRDGDGGTRGRLR